MTSRPEILDHTATLADPTRCRILDLVDRHELTVSELCDVMQLPQSTVSRHLKTLADGAWVRARRDGTSHYYGSAERTAAQAALWELVRSEFNGFAQMAQDHHRLVEVMAGRTSRTRAFFASAAGQWDGMRDELFGSRFDLLALLELVASDLVVGDLGCGTGRIAKALAPVVAEVVAVDGSPAMLEAARAQLGSFDNVEVLEGDLESLPIDDERLDVATLVLALHHAVAPARVVVEAARALRVGGRLLVVDMEPHDRESYRQEMGHVWLGFSAEQIAALFEEAGLAAVRVRSLPSPPGTTGPTLFVASGTKQRTKSE